MTSKTTSKVSSKHNRAPYERPTQEEIKKYQNAATPAATQRNTEMWIKRLKEFQNDIGYVENIEDIQSKSQLCNILIEFIIKMRPVNKQYYSSESIYNCVSALNRYFQNHSAIAPLDLFSEPVFKPLLNVVHSKMRENEQLNSLDIKKGADPLTEDEQKQILCHSSMRGDNPEGLLRRVFFWIANLTAARGGSHINIMASDFQRRPDGGYNFIIIHEKNNQGGLNSRRKKAKQTSHEFLSYHLMNLEQLMDLAMTYQNICVYDLKMQNPTFIYGPLVILKKLMKTYDVDAQQIMAFSGHHSLAGVNAYRMPNEKQMMEVTKKAFPARSNPSIVGKSSTLNTTRSSEFTRNSPISIEVVSKEEHCKSIIGLKSTSTKEIESTKVTKRDKFKTPFKGKFRSPLIDLNKKVPSDDSQSSQNMTLDLEGMKVHITNCNVTINISKN
ncbi:unnamed protein product [Rhizophagus irregularis]|uniref:Uncharacterized protein n=1 Tax=Rhizophagus irregularis TaxID=588596 RepID=A0A916E6H3_9GLOM|nr:unnamed protein product [Rhizophagus irregularis]